MVPYSLVSEGLCADTGQSAAIGGDYGQLSGQKHFLVLAFLVEEMNYLESSLGNLDKGWGGGGASCRVEDLYHVMKVLLDTYGGT